MVHRPGRTARAAQCPTILAGKRVLRVCIQSRSFRAIPREWRHCVRAQAALREENIAAKRRERRRRRPQRRRRLARVYAHRIVVEKNVAMFIRIAALLSD